MKNTKADRLDFLLTQLEICQHSLQELEQEAVSFYTNPFRIFKFRKYIRKHFLGE
jgi:hypothetical protein